MTELSEDQIQNRIVCNRCNEDYTGQMIEIISMSADGNCQMCRAELSGKFCTSVKPVVSFSLDYPPSVNSLTIYPCVYTMVYIINKGNIMSRLPSYTQKAKADYRKRIITISITINPKTELDIFKKIAEQDNKSGYIKELIRLDIEKELL